ncbi:MAG TPA: hypothetical protein VGI39_43580 [Polyangiaceae bacterium]|jgi:hypothetical protein
MATKRPAAKKSPAKKLVAKKPAPVADEADPRFVPVAKAFARAPGFSLMESKSRATRGLQLNGKSFGMSTHGRFVLKLDEARVEELIADGVGEPFYPSDGKVMKGWVEITKPGADWIALAREAFDLAKAAVKPANKKAVAKVKPAKKKVVAKAKLAKRGAAKARPAKKAAKKKSKR